MLLRYTMLLLRSTMLLIFTLLLGASVKSQQTPWLTDSIKLNINRRDFLKKKSG